MTAARREYAPTIGCVWTGNGGARCGAFTPDGSPPNPCDLEAGHEGVHFYILDHAADGEPLAIVTWVSEFGRHSQPGHEAGEGSERL